MKYYATDTSNAIRTTSQTVVLRVSETDELITEQNIASYKMQDMQYVTDHGGELASDEEYIAAEDTLQVMYRDLMYGEVTNV